MVHFNTLDEALESVDLLQHWDSVRVEYSTTYTRLLEIDGRYHYVSLTRDDKGQFAAPIHYDAGAITTLNNVLVARIHNSLKALKESGLGGW